MRTKIGMKVMQMGIKFNKYVVTWKSKFGVINESHRKGMSQAKVRNAVEKQMKGKVVRIRKIG